MQLGAAEVAVEQPVRPVGCELVQPRDQKGQSRGDRNPRPTGPCAVRGRLQCWWRKSAGILSNSPSMVARRKVIDTLTMVGGVAALDGRRQSLVRPLAAPDPRGPACRTRADFIQLPRNARLDRLASLNIACARCATWQPTVLLQDAWARGSRSACDG